MTPIQCVFYRPTTLIRRYLRRYFAQGTPCPHDYGDGYKRCCDAQVHLDDIELVRTDEGYIPSFTWSRDDVRWPKACEGCGREFPQDRDDHYTAPWQVHVDYLYCRDGEDIESKARTFYEAMPYDGPSGTARPAWQAGGNSLKQGEARRAVREQCEAGLIAMRCLPVGAIWTQDFGIGPTSIHCANRNGFAIEAARMMQLEHYLIRTPGGVWDMDTISTNGDGWQVTGEPPALTARPSILHSHGNRWHGWLTDGVLTQR